VRLFALGDCFAVKFLNQTFLFILLPFAVGCGQKPTGRLLVFGDSISYGAHVSESYPEILADSFHLTLENHSVSSTTLADDAQIGSIRRMKLIPGDRILFSPGINDALIHKLDPSYLATYERLLSESLDYFENAGVIALVGEPLRVSAQGWSSENTAQLAELNNNGAAYAGVLRRLIAKKAYRHVHLVESRERFHPLPNLMHDGVHPNGNGHRELFEIFRNAMDSAK
jgi:lysophospholipase L1-like esterase